MRREALRFEGVRVEDYRYGGLVDATFCLYEGETLALAGLMQSGKKSLMGILAGRLPEYEGSIFVFGQEALLDSYASVSACRIASIGEIPLLFENMSLADNIFLQNAHRRMFDVVQRTLGNPETERLFGELRLNLSDRPIEELSGFERRKLEILKAFHGGARILVFSSTYMFCSEAESEELARIFQALNRFGVCVIWESDSYLNGTYKDVVDRCMVVRNGMVTTTVYKGPDGTFDEAVLRHVVTGQAFGRQEPPPAQDEGDAFLRIADCNGAVLGVGRGAIVGLYDPNDKLPKTAEGLIAMLNAGYSVYLGEQKLVARSIADLVAQKIAIITREFNSDLIFGNLSPVENVCIYASHLFGGRFLYRKGTSEYIYDMLARKYKVLENCAGLKARMDSYDLSYEQQYELMIAKWLAMNPQLLVMYAPLSNHDMKNWQRYRDLLQSLARAGKVQVLISSSYQYLENLCSRTYEV